MSDCKNAINWIIKQLIGKSGKYSLSKEKALEEGIDLEVLKTKEAFVSLERKGVYMLPYSKYKHIDVFVGHKISDPNVAKPVDEALWIWPKYEAALVLDSLKLGENVIVNGPTGCGKSMLLQKLAEKENASLVRINLHNETDASALIGERIVGTDEDGNTVTPWMDGVAISCWEQGKWLLLDELDFSQPEHIACVQRIAEEYSDEFILAEDKGRRIKRHPDFRLLATSNSLGVTPNPELYAGTADLNEAFLDRWTLIQMNYHIEEERILKKLGIDEERTASIVELARNVRNAIDNGDIATTFSTRKIVKLAKKMLRSWEVKDAIEVVVLNKLRPDVRGIVEEICTRIFPEYSE